eukprot:365187-Chlamydomonas_euryale.AAC.18
MNCSDELGASTRDGGQPALRHGTDGEHLAAQRSRARHAVSSLEADVLSLEADVSSLEADVSSLEADVLSLEADGAACVQSRGG